jgi:hypothetical protein
VCEAHFFRGESRLLLGNEPPASSGSPSATAISAREELRLLGPEP